MLTIENIIVEMNKDITRKLDEITIKSVIAKKEYDELTVTEESTFFDVYEKLKEKPAVIVVPEKGGKKVSDILTPWDITEYCAAISNIMMLLEAIETTMKDIIKVPNKNLEDPVKKYLDHRAEDSITKQVGVIIDFMGETLRNQGKPDTEISSLKDGAIERLKKPDTRKLDELNLSELILVLSEVLKARGVIRRLITPLMKILIEDTRSVGKIRNAFVHFRPSQLTDTDSENPEIAFSVCKNDVKVLELTKDVLAKIQKNLGNVDEISKILEEFSTELN